MKIISRFIVASALAIVCALPLFAIPGDDIPLALTDPRMDQYWATHTRPPTIIVRLINGTPEERAKLAVSVNEPQLSKFRNRLRIASPRADGSYRIEFAPGIPLQQVGVRVGDAFGEFFLRENLEVAIDLSAVGKSLSSMESGVTLEGSDAAMNRAVHRFHAFRRQEVSKLNLLQNEIAYKGTSSFEDALKEFTTLQASRESILGEFGETEFLWLLRDQLECAYLQNVLLIAFRTKVDPMETPLREKIMAYQPLALGQETFNLLRAFAVNARNEASRNVVKKADKQKSSSENRGQDEELQIDRVLAFVEIGRRSVRPDLYQLAMGVYFGDTRFLTISAAQQLVNKIEPDWLRKTYQRELGEGAAKLSALQMVSPLEIFPSGARLFKLPDLSGTDLISALRSAHQDKALLLDFWGDWCAPCLRTLPKSKTMYENLAGEPVEFVYLACRTDEAAWRKHVQALQLPGVHILLTEAQTIQLQEKLEFTSFPFYAAIDMTGQITEARQVFDDPSPTRFRTILKLPPRN